MTLRRDNIDASVGQHLGTSRWFELDQSRIDDFADVTEDRQFIHLDADRAARDTPFGGTIAHGYLTLSMLSAMAYDGLPAMEGATSSLNYGFDKLRFLAPVRAGSKVRARFTLGSVTPKGADRLLVGLSVAVDIDGEDTPALVADWLVLYLF